MAGKEAVDFDFYPKPNSTTLDIALHGAGAGKDSQFMQKVIATLQIGPNSVLAFDFEYFARGDDHSSGPELLEELATLKQMMSEVDADKFEHVRFVAKSLGAIIASHFLKSLSRDEMQHYSVVVLGYVVGYVELTDFTGKIVVIQGEKDKFGGVEAVEADLAGAKSTDIEYHEIQGADHSYRNPETKEPIYEDKAVKILAVLD